MLGSGLITRGRAGIYPAFTLGGTVTLSAQVLDAGAVDAEFETTGALKGIRVRSSSTTHGAALLLQHDDTTPTLGGIAGTFVVKGYDGNASPALQTWGSFDWFYKNITDTTEQAELLIRLMNAGGNNVAAVLLGDGELTLDKMISFDQDVDSAAVADTVSISGYEIGAGHRALAISSEEVVVVEADETKFSHKLPVRINGATYNIMLCDS